MSTMFKTEFEIKPRYNKEETPDLAIHHLIVANEEARMMWALIEKWGLVAAMPDGEDSSGRAKLRLPTAKELVKRASDLTKAYLTEVEKNNWLVCFPSVAEKIEMAQDAENKREKNK